MTTASEVLRGVSLAGKTAIVTGGYSGVGLAATLALARAGAHVVVPARRPDVARQVLAGVAEVAGMDLADLASVRDFARHCLRAHPEIDILIASAGIMAVPETRVGPGWEAQFAVNHLGHFALAGALAPALGNARVVAVASGRDRADRIRWDDIHFTRGYDKWAAYAQSKLANVLFAHQLNARGIRAFSASPGYVLTPLQRHLPRAEMVAAGWIDADGAPAPGLFRTPEQGAATAVWAAASPDLDGHPGGAYCADCRATGDFPADAPEGERLWRYSDAAVGLRE